MTIREEAEYYRLLLAMRIIRRDDVIAWADQLLMQTAVPVPVLDVSLATKAKDYELDALLGKVPGDGDLALAAHAALCQFKLLLHELPLDDAIKRIISYGNTASIPEKEHLDACLFRDLYDGMLEGYSGSEEELWQRLHDFVNQHAQQPAGK